MYAGDVPAEFSGKADTIRELKHHCKRFIEMRSSGLSEANKHFLIQFSMFVITESSNVKMKPILPSLGEAIYTTDVEFADVHEITIESYKDNFDYFACKANSDTLLRLFQKIYCEFGSSFQKRVESSNIILASSLYELEMKSFSGNVTCRGDFTGWNNLNVTGSIVSELTAGPQYALAPFESVDEDDE